MDSITTQALESTIRQIIDSTTPHLIDSIKAQVIDNNEHSWLVEILRTAVIAGLVGFLLWFIQDFVEKRRKLRSEREQFARVWGLALFELREAISRSLSFSEKFSNGSISLGVLYFAKTVASDYFKLNSRLSVAAEMHWLYAMLNQIQENLNTSRATNEVARGGPWIYAGAASGFAKDHKDGLIAKFNFCLKEWADFCNSHGINMALELEMLRDSSDDTKETTESQD